jgi:hypothetical protein
MIGKRIVLRCSPERAFLLFTEEAGRWWPAERRHTDDAASAIRIEATGRFYERAVDGSEVELGVARVFDPPRRLLLDWYPGTGPAHPTQVEIRFAAVDGGTEVTVAHAIGTAPAEVFARNAPRYAQSWDRVLEALAAAL